MRNLYLSIAVLALIVSFSVFLIFAAENRQLSEGIKRESNFTSTMCIDDKPCVTTICINNEPCNTITSSNNSTTNTANNNSIGKNNNKHIIVSPFPHSIFVRKMRRMGMRRNTTRGSSISGPFLCHCHPIIS
jgi:hypothetical protein